jgi:hypothetical protein
MINSEDNTLKVQCMNYTGKEVIPVTIMLRLRNQLAKGELYSKLQEYLFK